MSAQPNPKPISNEPVMTLSVPPAKTTSVRTRAAAMPAARDPAMMRPTGPGLGAAGTTVSVPSSGWPVVWWMSTLMTVSLSQWWFLLSSVAVNGFAHPGQMAGIDRLAAS